MRLSVSRKPGSSSTIRTEKGDRPALILSSNATLQEQVKRGIHRHVTRYRLIDPLRFRHG
jgi:hypothetical protein